MDWTETNVEIQFQIKSREIVSSLLQKIMPVAGIYHTYIYVHHMCKDV